MNKANTLILFCFILNTVLPYPAAAGPVRAPEININVNQREIPQQDPQQIITDFYNGKAEAALKNIKTYRDRYNAISFYSYPRTFWNDVIPTLPPFDRKGALFTLSLQDTYNDIKAQKNPDTKAMAAWAVNQIILNPRRAEVAKQTEMPQPGDIWHNAFYMASFYTQLSDFAEKIRSEEADYKEYKKHLAIKDPKTRDFMLAGYEDRDFSIAQAKYDRGIFFERMKDIQDFITAYAADADIFIRKVLAPLQTNEIPGADVKKYLEERVLESELPEGISKQAFINIIMTEIPNPQEIQKQAEEINPSFQKQILALAAVRYGDFSKLGTAASLFEYISPGTLIERLPDKEETWENIATSVSNNYIELQSGVRVGRTVGAGVVSGFIQAVPSREENLQKLSALLAAGALNKSLAQIADGLMEFEKPFYYSYNSFGYKEEAVGKSWHAIATNDSYKDQIIAKIATDNILQSGRTGYQTSGLSRSIKARRIKENTEFYGKAIPIAVDFTSAGNMFFILSERIFRGGKYIAKMRKTDELKAAINKRVVTETSVAQTRQTVAPMTRPAEVTKTTTTVNNEIVTETSVAQTRQTSAPVARPAEVTNNNRIVTEVTEAKPQVKITEANASAPKTEPLPQTSAGRTPEEINKELVPENLFTKNVNIKPLSSQTPEISKQSWVDKVKSWGRDQVDGIKAVNRAAFSDNVAFSATPSRAKYEAALAEIKAERVAASEAKLLAAEHERVAAQNALYDLQRQEGNLISRQKELLKSITDNNVFISKTQKDIDALRANKYYNSVPEKEFEKAVENWEREMEVLQRELKVGKDFQKKIDLELSEINGQLTSINGQMPTLNKVPTVTSGASTPVKTVAEKFNQRYTKSDIEKYKFQVYSSNATDKIYALKKNIPVVGDESLVRVMSVSAHEDIVKIINEGLKISETGYTGVYAGTKKDTGHIIDYIFDYLYRPNNPKQDRLHILLELDKKGFSLSAADAHNGYFISKMDVPATNIKEIYIATKDGNWVPLLK